MSRFGSLDQIRKKEEEEQKKQQGEEYFAGGIDGRSGGGSGMAVQGPPPDRRGDAFDDLVQRAHASSGVAAAGADGSDVSTNKRKITLYKNGFIIDDNGILRDTNLPENAEVIRELEAGRVPAELSLVDGNPLHGMDVALEDRRGEDFVPPPPPAYKAFSGGNTLGAATAVSDASNGAADAPCVFTPEALSGVEATVDAAKASTTVQVKTPAGKKIRIKVNEEFTVLQVAAFVARESGSTGNFTLSAGFPPKPLTNAARDQSVKGAGLAGASINQNNV